MRGRAVGPHGWGVRGAVCGWGVRGCADEARRAAGMGSERAHGWGVRVCGGDATAVCQSCWHSRPHRALHLIAVKNLQVFNDIVPFPLKQHVFFGGFRMFLL